MPGQGAAFRKAVLRALLILPLAAAGGALFKLLHLPLPWTLGAMTVAALLSVRDARHVLPPVFRDGARPVIGVVAGSAFTPLVLGQITGWWPVFLVLICFFLLVSQLGAAVFRHFGFDRPTAFFAASPGGLGEMAFLGEQFGAQVRDLVLVHSVRIIAVVTLVPFVIAGLTGVGGAGAAIPAPDPRPEDWAALVLCTLAGYLVGRRLRAWGGLMLVPMLFSALLHGSGLTVAVAPYWLVAAMQVVIGCITGARFAGLHPGRAGRVLLIGLGWSLALIGLSIGLAALLARVVALPPAALFLALAPGGFAEMSVIAYAAGIEVAFVVTCHAFRTLYIMLVSPVLCRWALAR